MLSTNILSMDIDFAASRGARRVFRVFLRDRSRHLPSNDVVTKVWSDTPKSLNIITVIRRDEEKRTLFLSLPADTSQALRQRFLQKLEDEILGNTK